MLLSSGRFLVCLLGVGRCPDTVARVIGGDAHIWFRRAEIPRLLCVLSGKLCVSSAALTSSAYFASFWYSVATRIRRVLSWGSSIPLALSKVSFALRRQWSAL